MIYIVYGETGSYSDWRCWIVGARTERHEAEMLRDELTQVLSATLARNRDEATQNSDWMRRSLAQAGKAPNRDFSIGKTLDDEREAFARYDRDLAAYVAAAQAWRDANPFKVADPDTPALDTMAESGTTYSVLEVADWNDAPASVAVGSWNDD